MAVCLVAFHFAQPERRDELVRRVREAAQIMSGTPGCLGVECWREPATDAVVAIGRWENEDSRVRSFAAVRQAHMALELDDRQSCPSKVFSLESPA